MKTIADIINSFRDNGRAAFVNKTGYRTFKTSYSQLRTKIMQAASFLEHIGLGKGDRMIIWGYNCPEWGIIFLAAAFRGVIAVPVDHMAMPEHVERIQSIVKAKAIAHSEYKRVPELGARKIVIEHIEKLAGSMRALQAEDGPEEDDLAEIVFTSGTTGHPKGVMLTHKNIISNISAIRNRVKILPDQTFLSLLPMSHLLEQTPGFLGPLSAGCTIVYVRSLRPELIFKALSQEGITNIVLVPRLLKLFADSITRELDKKHAKKPFRLLAGLNLPRQAKKAIFFPIHLKFGTRFKYFIVGGAPLSIELHSFWKNIGFTVLQGYGLTECAPVLTCNTEHEQKEGSVGKPLPNVDIKISKDGEILARGDNITPGYYNDRARTKSLFQDGWMKTGDVGLLDSEGFLLIKGRKKDVIVTSGGEKIHPEDVEAELLKIKGVKDACALGLPAPGGDELVHAEMIMLPGADIAYAVKAANESLSQTQQITSYARWHGEDFPRTTTMKIKKAAVLEAIMKRKEKMSAAPKSAVNERLLEALSRIEGVDAGKISPTARLAADLRLTSVNRVELASMLEQEFNMDVNEEEITGETKVIDIEQMIKNREKAAVKKIFRRWTLLPPITALRMAYNLLVTDTFIRLLCRTKTTGAENLKGMAGPAIFISNHVGYMDTPNILLSLQMKTRTRLAVAAWHEYFHEPNANMLKKMLLRFYYEYATIFVNIFPFPKQKGFKRHTEYVGELIDKGWNVLFFPEGEHSKTGGLQPFRPGIGWLAREMRVPIVPIRHFGLENVLKGEDTVPKPGNVLVKIGKPVTPDYMKSIPAITAEMQELIEKM